jgi:hypothetical protein
MHSMPGALLLTTNKALSFFNPNDQKITSSCPGVLPPLRTPQVRTIPVYFAWIPKMSYCSFASNILAENEFAGLMFKTPAGIAVPAERFIPDAMKNGLSLTGNMGVLVGITLGSRLVCMLLREAAAYWRFL